MTFRPDHELHRRRLGRNVGVGIVLLAFCAVVFGLTVVKISTGQPFQAFDHVPRPILIPQEAE
ncbi:MAG: hypothetical protein ACK4KW_09940 [Gemmobacter sp.]